MLAKQNDPEMVEHFLYLVPHYRHEIPKGVPLTLSKTSENQIVIHSDF